MATRLRARGAGDRRDRPDRAAGRRAAGATRGRTAARGHRARRPRPDRRAWRRRSGATTARWLADGLEKEIGADPEALTVVVAEAGDEVVSAGWVRYVPGTAFATLWGGSTLPAWRRRGIYRALVALPGPARRGPRLHAAPGRRVRRQPPDPGAPRLCRGHHDDAVRLHSLMVSEPPDARRARHPEARRIRRGLSGVQCRPRLPGDAARERRRVRRLHRRHAAWLDEVLTTGALPKLPREPSRSRRRCSRRCASRWRSCAAKAPDLVDAYRSTVLAAAERAATAVHGVNDQEAAILAKVRVALA